MRQDPRRDRGRRGDDRRRKGPQGRRKGGSPRRGPPKGRPGHQRRGPVHPRETAARGRASDVGLDGRLRVDLTPLPLATVEALTKGRGAEVLTPRGERLGTVQGIVGTLERPIAIVKLDREARELATAMRGREVLLG